jgi:hypothetical protein
VEVLNPSAKKKSNQRRRRGHFFVKGVDDALSSPVHARCHCAGFYHPHTRSKDAACRDEFGPENLGSDLDYRLRRPQPRLHDLRHALFATDANGEIKPQMIGNYEVSIDKMTYTFTLRDGLFWHDGQPVTAVDCIASIKRWAAKDSTGQKLMSFVFGMEAKGAKPFVMKLKEPTDLALIGARVSHLMGSGRHQQFPCSLGSSTRPARERCLAGRGSGDGKAARPIRTRNRSRKAESYRRSCAGPGHEDGHPYPPWAMVSALANAEEPSPDAPSSGARFLEYGTAIDERLSMAYPGTAYTA